MGPIDIRFYLSIFWRRLPYFLVVAVLITAVGLTVAVLLPPSYRATASILVESEQIPGELAASTVGVQAVEQIQIVEQRMMTRDNLLKLARELGVYDGTEDMTASEIVADMRGRTRFERLNLGIGGATGFSISFTAPEPEVTARVVNEIVTLVLEENVRLRTGRATDTLDFFEQEVDRLGGELDRLANRILEFKTENEDALPDSLEFRRNEQSRLQERLLQLEREETTLRDTRARLVEIYERTGRLRTGEVLLSAEEEELDGLRQELEQQRVVLSETNPRIVLLRNRIAALEKIVADQREAAGLGDGDGPLTDLDLQLQELDGRLDYIGAETVRLERELQALTASIQATPENDLTLRALERSHDNVQAQYNEAVAALAAAATGERIELLSKGERFSVIEQASVPQWPDSPNRKLIAAASVLAGFGAGLGLVLLLEMLNRSIRRPAELTAGLGIQAFGTVPYVRTRRERLAKRAIVGTVLLLFAVAVPAALWALHTYYLPLDLLAQKVVETLGLDTYLDMLG